MHWKVGLLSSVIFTLAGCGSNDVTETEKLQTVRIDIGGEVFYAFDSDEFLDGVAVTATDRDGTQTTATTANGIWFMVDLAPGPYALEFSLSGYLTVIFGIDLNAGGENDIENIYQDQGLTTLEEIGLVATFSGAFEATLDLTNDLLLDGVAGFSASYSLGTGGDIVVTFNKPVFGMNSFATQGANGTVLPTANTAQTVWTFTEADLATILVANTSPFAFSSVNLSIVQSYTDIHGDPISLSAQIGFNVAN